MGVGLADLESHFPLKDEEELLGRLAFTDEHLPDLVGPDLGVRDHRVDEGRVDSREERVTQDEVGHRFLYVCAHFFP